MCDECNFKAAPTRRDLLKFGALGMAGLLAGCKGDSTVSNLPDAYDGPTAENAGQIHVDPKTLETRPVLPPQKTEYGDLMPRAAWTRSPLVIAGATPINGVTRVTIHHSGDGKPFMGESIADVARHLQIVREVHLQRGMIDIAYHFAIDRVGCIWQLRWLNYEGQHVRVGKNGVRNNEHNIGIVMLGDFNVQGVTVPQRDRLVAFANLVRVKYALVSADGKPRPNTLFMHGELVDTDCPGRQLKPLILDARRRGLI